MRGLRGSCLLFLPSFTTLVFSFGTINEPLHIGQHSEHERLSRAAFRCHPKTGVSDGVCFEELSLMQLAGTSGPDLILGGIAVPGELMGNLWGFGEVHVGRGLNGAVGAPDTLDPVPEGPEAHCDNADFLDSLAFGLEEPYPRTRAEATKELQTCINHLRRRFGEGLDAADNIVDEHARIVEREVEIKHAHCTFSFPELQMHLFSRSKCSTIEGLGRALHGIQDFYAHSNWADDAAAPFGPDNPPGLKRDDAPVFLDLRGDSDIAKQVPHNLSTGCFGGILSDGPLGKQGHPLEPGSMDCTGRITHHTLNKDNGYINSENGTTSDPGPNTPRSDIEGNFDRAVQAAIRDSRRQWRYFREEIRRLYGTERGNIIICSLVRDNPAQDCYGRRIAIIRDAYDGISGGNRIAQMQIPISHWLQTELRGQQHDEGAHSGPISANTTKNKGWGEEMPVLNLAPTHHYDISPKPLISQGLDMSTSVLELIRNASDVPANKSAIVAISTIKNHHLSEQLAHVMQAGDEGIRVHLGLLPLQEPLPFGPLAQADVEIAQDQKREEDLITAVLRSGGTYSILHHRSYVSAFLDHVISRGLTQYDNAQDTATHLVEGLAIADYVTPDTEPRRYSFDAHALDNVVLSVAPITSRLKLHVTLRHVRKNVVLREFDIGLGGNATFRAELGLYDVPMKDAWFELEVAHVQAERLVGSGLFEVSLETEHGGHEWEHEEL
ncbi:hypothetical protein EJ08DRAFT_648904 [Tothia fuscella]|uniref:Uncharacterized protein n=1 Tax=Tothia fuscella TaxID=1048955 RepID=A0A9P4TZG5_9PEZI|nr:hypothetical protein EJ08DRAFT_648904 [Tothia fuscella]